LPELVERVRQASLRAGDIVRRIRNFVRPGAMVVLPVELVALVREVVELCQPEAQRAAAALVFEPAGRAEAVVEADPIQIQQVLVNLIQNALHAVAATPVGERQVALRLSVRDDAVQIDVIDNGQGLGQADAEELFTPFHSTKADGLGIGLSICRSIVAQHRGTIWAQPATPQGAQFSFVLPRLTSHAAEHDQQADGVCR
jgi:signal transduction histidine kinase